MIRRMDTMMMILRKFVKASDKKRRIVYGLLLIYYLVQLIVFETYFNSIISKKYTLDFGSTCFHYIGRLNILLLLTTIVSLVLGWLRPIYFERLTVFINSVLFSFIIGWLIVSTVYANTLTVCYCLNIMIAVWLL